MQRGRKEEKWMPDETFSDEDEQVMTGDVAEADNLLPSFRGRRKNTNEIETGIAAKRRKINYTDKKLKMRLVVKLKRLKPKEKKNLDEKLTKSNPRVVIEKLDLKKSPYSAHIETKQKPDQKLLKLRPVVKIKKLNFRKNPYYKKRPKEEPKKTQNLNEKLTKGNPRVMLAKLDLKKTPYSANIQLKYKLDEKLLKLRPVVKISKLNLRKNPYYKKQPKEELKKMQNPDEKLTKGNWRVKLEKLD